MPRHYRSLKSIKKRSAKKFSAESPNKQENHQIYSRDPAKWTDIAIVVVALVALIISAWQWQVARDQLRFAVKSAKDSSDDTKNALSYSNRLSQAAERQAALAKDALKIAEGQLKISDRSLQQQMRGQLLLFIEPIPFPSVGQSITGHLVVQNVGNTSVHHTEIVVTIIASPSNQNPALSDKQEFFSTAPTTNLSPQARTGVSVKWVNQVTTEFMNAFATESYSIYVFGKIRYIDSANHKHVQHICSAFTGKAENWQGGACATLPDS